MEIPIPEKTIFILRWGQGHPCTQKYTVKPHCNMINFLSKNSQETHHSLPMRTTYGVSIASSKSDIPWFYHCCSVNKNPDNKDLWINIDWILIWYKSFGSKTYWCWSDVLSHLQESYLEMSKQNLPTSGSYTKGRFSQILIYLVS